MVDLFSQYQLAQLGGLQTIGCTVMHDGDRFLTLKQFLTVQMAESQRCTEISSRRELRQIAQRLFGFDEGGQI